MQDEIVWIDGRLSRGESGDPASGPQAPAGVSVLDHGLLYGDGVFEGIRAYAGRPFRLGAHLDRLARSAAALRLALPWARGEIAAAVEAVIARAGGGDGYLRLIVTRGRGTLGLDPRSCPRPSLIIVSGRLTLFPADSGGGGGAPGISAIIAATRQPDADVLDPRVKSLNYLPRILARQQASDAGADEAILLNRQGRVTEGTSDNVFAVCRGVLRTPPATDGALEGITRQVVLELAADAGIPAEIAPLAPYDLHTADELFLSGTAAELIPVRRIDGRTLPACPGPVFTRLEKAFRALVARETAP